MTSTPDIDLRGAEISAPSEGGFTLVELLIVIVILAILAAIVVFAVGTTTKNAVAASCSADAKSVESALSAYDAQMGSYPASLSALTSSTTASNGSTVGPWLRALPGTAHYVISADTSGSVYLTPPGGAATQNSTTNFDQNTDICSSFT